MMLNQEDFKEFLENYKSPDGDYMLLSLAYDLFIIPIL